MQFTGKTKYVFDANVGRLYVDFQHFWHLSFNFLFLSSDFKILMK